ncbi:Uu.00g089090.m01.CDS01 [Anthostomella pinea]|uniref:Uu.00g089090.m01.CDS01 n=1 Tax=Anthostomella pinea TaxID=933095 RepID=A0AAI8VMR2_9PEZI|nr:Uu.00g089090.m01.CDS01 [Anthostomella pinea]
MSPSAATQPAHGTGTGTERKRRGWARAFKSHNTTNSSPGDDVVDDGGNRSTGITSSTRISGRSRPRWWKIHLFRGMVNDVRRRAPYYWSDWRDAWDYRVVPSTIYMYFANTVYDIMSPTGTNYLAFMCWIGLWSLIFHWILAVTNACNWLKYVTRFPCDIFGFYVAFIYLQKGIQVLERFGNDSPFYLSVMVALLVFMIAYICGELGGNSALFRHPVRVFVKDYGTPLTVIFFTGFIHFGRMKTIDLEKLPTSAPFLPTADRSWLVHFWDISVGDVFIAMPFAILLTILFYFDHNVSSLIAQGTEFPLRKPAGFHWDIFLLGITTGVAGILGLPFPNGLIPQAPFHTESLCVTKVEVDTDETSPTKGHFSFRRTHVVEQRLSNFAQGLLTLGTMSGPLLVVLHLIPQAVLAGLFFIMGYQALEANGITAKILFLLRDGMLTQADHPLRQIERRAAVWAFVVIELVGFGATFAITQTVAAVGFPIIILALIPVRAAVLPRFFRKEELALLDGPTASPFTMESVGGSYGGGEEALGGGDGGDGGRAEKGSAGSVPATATGSGQPSVLFGGADERKSGDVLAEEGRGSGEGEGEGSEAGVDRRGPSVR